MVENVTCKETQRMKFAIVLFLEVLSLNTKKAHKCGYILYVMWKEDEYVSLMNRKLQWDVLTIDGWMCSIYKWLIKQTINRACYSFLFWFVNFH